ncbi:MAG: hypothetical protein JSS02_30945 [Planctomycetes bacterium]|nr:hypothetical protein [Planctomycetota bacterium]
MLTCFMLTGCRRTYNTTAVYQAPQAGFEAVVTAAGSFSTDYDLNPIPTGQATLTPLDDRQLPTITLEFPGNETVHYQIDSSPPATLPWGSLNSQSSLQQILEQAGYQNLIAGEIAEITMAIEGVTYGPKGTLGPGKGNFITAVSVVNH